MIIRTIGKYKLYQYKNWILNKLYKKITPLFLLLVLSSFFPGFLIAQEVVFIDKSNSYSVDFETETDGWVHARSDYGTGGWNSTEGNFKMTCTSLDENGLGDIIQRPYIYFEEEGNYTMTFRIKTDEPVNDFRVTLGDFTGVHRNFVHEFSLIEAQNQWKEYTITFSTKESGNGYDEGNGSGVPSKGIWVAFRTKQTGSYSIDDIQLKRFPLILNRASILGANEIVLSFNQEVEVPETTQGFICMDGSTNIAITGIKGVEHNPNILILSTRSVLNW